MMSKTTILIVAMALTSFGVFAQHDHSGHSHGDKTTHTQTSSHKEEATFKVKGNCQMCKKRIESSLKDIDGVKKAKWDVDTKLLNVSYDSKKVTLEYIKNKVASVGHDTEGKRASDKAYNELPMCCQYKREE